jgi:hypothetical protein
MIELKTGVSGRFKVQVAKADAEGLEIPGSRRTVADWQENLITNTGMDYMGGVGSDPYTFLSAVSVGSGATAPAFTDSALQARVATTQTTNATTFGFSTTTPFYSWFRREFQFAAGAAAGVLSELGVTGTAGTPAYTRALIKNSGGLPITITVLSDELLVVTYERRIYAYESDVTATATIKNVSTAITIRPSQVGTSGGMSGTGGIYWSNSNSGGYWYTGGAGAGPITGKPSGTEQYPTTAKTDHAYVNGTYYRDQSMNLSITELAGLNINGFVGRNSAINYQIGFVPSVAKAGSETVALRLRMSWARYTP